MQSLWRTTHRDLTCRRYLIVRLLHSTSIILAGHNKWSKVKHIKAKEDAIKSKIYSRASADIMLAIRLGGTAEPANNLRLATALATARKNKVPRENIENAIKRATGGTAQKDLESITYEGIGPGGVALIIEALTDNKVRTIARVREILKKHGGSLADTQFLFDKKGIIEISLSEGKTLDNVLEDAIEVGAEDVQDSEDGHVRVLCEHTQLMPISQALVEKFGYSLDLMQVGYIPNSTVEIDQEGEVQTLVIRLIETLEDEPGIVEVYDNIA